MACEVDGYVVFGGARRFEGLQKAGRTALVGGLVDYELEYYISVTNFNGTVHKCRGYCWNIMYFIVLLREHVNGKRVEFRPYLPSSRLCNLARWQASVGGIDLDLTF